MKRMRKIVSIMLAMVMVLGMGVTAFAADNHEHTITINGNKDDKGKHTYQAYQIFAGDLADNPAYATDKTKPKYILSNITWGSGVTDGEAVLNALKSTDAFNVKESVLDCNEEHEHTDACRRKEVEKNAFAECKTAADVAAVVSGFASSDKSVATLADKFAKVVSDFLSDVYQTNGNGADANAKKIHVNGSGYYMIKDMDESLDVSQNDAAYTRLLLQVIGDESVNVKSEVPSGKKEVFYAGADALGQVHKHDDSCRDAEDNLSCGKDENEFTYDPSLNRGEANNAGIGDHVTFQITSKVPNYVGYDYYYFIMNDKMSDGLTFDGASTVVVKIGDEELKQGSSVLNCKTESHVNDKDHDDSCYVVTPGDYYVYVEDDHSFRVAFGDIMEVNDDGTQKWEVGEEVVVTYSARVNENAVIGTSGNANTWSLEYSRDPNENYRPGTNPNRRPGLPVDENTTVLGKTPDDVTLTYVTELDITKYANEIDETDLTKNLLAGAEFTLTGTSYQVVTNTVKYYVENPKGTFYKLLDGTFTNEEPIYGENGGEYSYKEIGVGTETTTTGYIKNDKGEYVVPADVKDYNGATLYKRVKSNDDKYADLNVKYSEVEATKTEMVPVEVAIEMTTDSTGKISFKGLGAGEYVLTETITPAGYNTIKPIKFTITWQGPDHGVTSGEEECIWNIESDDLQWSENGNNDSKGGIFAANIINVSGLLLPSTGGIGTTIFYVAGSILVLAAVVLLVTKKRMVREK